ncbi:hypothetical protein B0G82_7826 [Paraburkholderia sp. BL17N1]|nr:hypothetical protein B0G82_7826 [Paraburkholderia sp. BL17N1]
MPTTNIEIVVDALTWLNEQREPVPMQAFIDRYDVPGHPLGGVMRETAGLWLSTMQQQGMLELSLKEQKIHGLTEYGKAVLTQARGLQG